MRQSNHDKWVAWQNVKTSSTVYIEALSWPDRDQALDEAIPEACQKFDVPDVHVH